MPGLLAICVLNSQRPNDVGMLLLLSTNGQPLDVDSRIGGPHKRKTSKNCRCPNYQRVSIGKKTRNHLGPRLVTPAVNQQLTSNSEQAPAHDVHARNGVVEGIWGFPSMGVTQNGWFFKWKMGIPISGTPHFVSQETNVGWMLVECWLKEWFWLISRLFSGRFSRLISFLGQTEADMFVDQKLHHSVTGVIDLGCLPVFS